MTRSQQQPNSALQTIFSFFLGLMVLAFIGIGVNTFYPAPYQRYQEELQKLYREQEQFNMKNPDLLDEDEKAESERIQTRINELQDQQTAQEKPWARNTSIVLITFATLVMAISLIRSEQLRVISNGLLLGGLFTMVYGVGWVIFSGESTARFIVILVAFVITLGLGYIKFVRQRAEESAAVVAVPAAGSGVAIAADSPGFADLAARVAALEQRTSAAAAALGVRDEE